ncbi:InlB B-repeat-containing protein, partial [Neobacillus drentensis]|uniref:InlB B-repeat-containing protein n=1 Tax=Neobacillus drentensis TaxID=220684 RepID=UPI002FFDF51D
GWYKDAACTMAWDFVNDIVPATNITLYAKWTTNSYTVNFDSQGGSAITGIYANYHSKITAPTAPTKVGYTFGGWYKDAACTTEWDFANDTVSNNTTLYAKWNINSYTVTFNSQGGSTVKSVKVNYNSLIQTPTSPTRAGYTFVGWYKEPSGVNIWSFATQKVLNNTTLYAKWVANPTNPTNVKAVSSSYNSVNVSWGAITGASGYEIYRATSSGGNYSLLTSTTKNSFSNTGLTANNMYYYKVRAYKLVGSTKVYSGWSVVVSAKPIPSTPVGLKLVKATTTSIKATWTVVTGATKYEVWVATSSIGVFAKKAEVSSATGTITGLSRGKTYYIKVRAYRLIGKTKVYSGYSKVAVLKI